MSSRLVIAPAGHGKTAHAIEAIRSLSPLSPVRVLVPDQIVTRAFRRRIAQAGGAIGVQVQTFYGLYADVLSLAGQTLHLPQLQPTEGMPHLTPAVRQRLIQHTAECLYDAGDLSYYAPVRSSPGFARLLGSLYGELKRGRVFPEKLGDALERSEPRLSELARLYGAKLSIIYVVEQEVFPGHITSWRKHVSAEVPGLLEELKESLHKELKLSDIKDVEIQVQVGEGDGKAHKEICSYIEKNDIDLVVMGTYGLSGVEKVLLGSTTERVIRMASCPVMAFRMRESE